MKFPTDAELKRAAEVLQHGDEQSPQQHARNQLQARHYLRELAPRFLDGPYWFDVLEYMRLEESGQGQPDRRFRSLASAGLTRGFPLAGAVSLEVSDPLLYEALVAEELSRTLPSPVTLVSLSYENPFLGILRGAKNAEKVASTTVAVIETARDYGPKRKMAKADAEVAEAVVAARIEDRELDVAIKREQLRAAQLENDMRAQALRERQVAAAIEERRVRLMLEAERRGQHDVAEVIRELDSGDVATLSALGRRELEIAQTHEPDPEDTEG